MTPVSSAIVEEFAERAERLAHLFSILDRPRTLESPHELEPDTALVEQRDGRTLKLPRKVFDDLRKIECANLDDQEALVGQPNLRTLWSEYTAPGRTTDRQ
jgi:hypothetical protein